MSCADYRAALIERLAEMIARGAAVTVGPFRCAAVETFDDGLRITMRFPRADWDAYCAGAESVMPAPDRLVVRKHRSTER